MAVAGIRKAQQAPHYLLQGVDLHRTVPWNCNTGRHAWILGDALESFCYFSTSKLPTIILQLFFWSVKERVTRLKALIIKKKL